MNKLFYKLVHFTVRCFAKLFFSLKVSGEENIPDSGGAILACNHTSYWDPPIASTSFTKRPTWFFAKSELFKIPIFNKIITALGSFPVERKKADRKALNKALNLLASGEILLVFPEGTRNKTSEKKKGEAGAAFLALKAKVPVIPMAIIQKKLIKNIKNCIPIITQLKVNIGKPIYFNASETPEEALAKIMQKIEDLKVNY